jgi:hypothetical protein
MKYTFLLLNILFNPERNKKKKAKKKQKNKKTKKQERFSWSNYLESLCECPHVYVRERERETIFINVGRRVAINLLDILQQSLQTPGCNR